MREEDFLVEEAKRAASDAARQAAFVEWLANQPESFQRLATDLFALQDERHMQHGFEASMLRDKRGRLVYQIRCANGVHQSHDGYEHAMTLLLDSFRIGHEDKAETHARMMAVMGVTNIKHARDACARLAREAPAHLSHEERDAHVEAVLVKLERASDSRGV